MHLAARYSIGFGLVAGLVFTRERRILRTRWFWMGGLVAFLAAAPGAESKYLITGLSESAQAELARTLALTAERTAPGGVPLKRPRIGLVQPWSGSMDEGWTRWVLEQYEFNLTSIHNADIRADGQVMRPTYLVKVKPETAAGRADI